MIQIAPSLLSCSFSQLEQEIKAVEDGGAEVLHLDIMDGHFVPNITFGPVIIAGIRELTTLILDTHLMIEEPERWVKDFVHAGADWISFHYEATKDPGEVIKLIKENNKVAGIAINPDTPVEVIYPWVEEVDFVVIMTVDPGFGGQKFIREPLEKVKVLDKKGIKVEVDGGIKLHNVEEVVKAGAKIIVSGSGVFKTENPFTTVKEFRKIIESYQ